MEDNSNNNTGGGIGCLGDIVLLLVILKLFGTINISWGWIILLIILFV